MFARAGLTLSLPRHLFEVNTAMTRYAIRRVIHMVAIIRRTISAESFAVSSDDYRNTDEQYYIYHNRDKL